MSRNINRSQYNGRLNNYQFRGQMNTDMPMYAFIVIVILGAGIQMNLIKIPGMNVYKIPQKMRKRKPQSESKPSDTSNGTKEETKKIRCRLDCNSIPGSSCVNGKCTDPYLQL